MLCDIRGSYPATRKRGVAQIRRGIGEDDDRRAALVIEHDRCGLAPSHTVFAEECTAWCVPEFPTECLLAADPRSGVLDSEQKLVVSCEFVSRQACNQLVGRGFAADNANRFRQVTSPLVMVASQRDGLDKNVRELLAEIVLQERTRLMRESVVTSRSAVGVYSTLHEQ